MTAATLSALVVGDRPPGSRDDGGWTDFRFALDEHVEVLRRIPEVHWLGIVAPAPDLVRRARNEWDAQIAETELEAVGDHPDVDIVVALTEPENRAEIVQQFPAARWIIVEPPLGLGLSDSEAFVELCATNGKHLIVNGSWRADTLLKGTAAGEFTAEIGDLIAGGGIYGDGIWHLGPLWVDVVQMLAGDVDVVRAIGDAPFLHLPVLQDDQAPSFAFRMASGAFVCGHAGTTQGAPRSELELWGTKGRLSLAFHADATHISCTSADGTVTEAHSPCGDALRSFYGDVVRAADGGAIPFDGMQALHTERIISAILNSAEDGGDAYHFG